MTYYMETKRWKALTPQAQKDLMEKFEYIKAISFSLPPGIFVRKIVDVYPAAPQTIRAALNLSVFNERILEYAFHVAHYLTDLSPAEQKATPLKNYITTKIPPPDDDEW